MKVTFVSQGNSILASHRYRVETPVAYLNTFVDGVEAVVKTKADTQSDINVFQKHFDQAGNLLAMASAKDFGYLTVFDVCDDHFDRAHGDYYERMCQLADHITCNSANMQERIYEVTGKLATIIPDPVTFPKITPDKKDYSEPRILWFGHSSNVEPLLKWADKCPFRITAVCNAEINHTNIDFHLWGLGVVESLIKDHNVVILPKPEGEHVKCKSPNRALDAINSGCYVLSDNLDVYSGLPVNFCSLEAFLSEFKNYDHEADILRAQSFVDKNFKNQVILDSWLDVFQKLGVTDGNPS